MDAVLVCVNLEIECPFEHSQLLLFEALNTKRVPQDSPRSWYNVGIS